MSAPSTTRVRDVMQRRVTTIGDDDSLALAQQLMAWREVRHLPVVRGGRVLGVLSERDVLRGRADPALGLTAKVKDVMSCPPAHVHPNAELADAAAELTTKKLGCLPVIQAGELVGMLTTSDVLGAMAQHPVPSVGEGLHAADLMSRSPATVSPDDSLLDAAAKMTSRSVRHLCVVDAEQRILGMLSDRDLRTQIGDPVEAAGRDAPGRYLSALRVRHAMTEGARVAVAETPLGDLVNIFLVEHVGAVPVVDGDGKVEGVVSYIDVLRAVAAGVAA